MKALLPMLVLLCGALEVLSSPLRVKRNDAQEMENLVELLNTMRQEVGRELGIFMEPLVHDTRLDGIAAGFPSDCSEWDHGQDYRMTPMTMNTIGVKTWEFYLNVAVNPGAVAEINSVTGQNLTPEQFLNKATLFSFEFFNPDQTKVGCAAVSCSTKVPDEFVQLLQLNENMVFYTGACVLGPHSVFDMNKLRTIAKSSTLQGQVNGMWNKLKIANEKSKTRTQKLNSQTNVRPEKQFVNPPAAPPPPPASTAEPSSSSSFAKFLISISLVFFILLD